jgi:putative ABC transport system permease protein
MSNLRQSILQTSWQDLRFAARMLAKSPSFTAIALLTLALGIGVNTSIFSLVNAILIRPLPYPDSGQLVGLGQSRMQQGAGYIQTGVSYPNVVEIVRQNTVFQQVAYYRFHPCNLTGENTAPERVLSFQISASFLPMFGVDPRLGRFFSADETQPGKDAVAIISYGLWQRRFAGAPDILGKFVTLDERRYTIIGVMPRDFQFTWDAPVDLLVPLALAPSETAESARVSRNLETLARMKPGITHDQAQSEMHAVADRLAQAYPANKGWNITVEPLHAAYYRHLAEPLLVLLGAVSFVLLIVCANVANLLLSRITARRREISIRLAIGASKGRLIRQLLTENLLLAVLGGLCGLLLAYWGTSLLRTQAVHFLGVPGVKQMHLDWRVLLYTLGLAFLTSFVFGIVPALHAAKTNLNDSLKESALSVSSDAGHSRLRSTLVVVEIALAIVLMAGAGLLIRTFAHLVGVDLGFNPANAVSLSVDLPEYKYSTGVQQSAFFNAALQRIRALPGIESAASVAWQGDIFFIPGAQQRPVPGQEPTAGELAISPDYFRAMGAKFLAGRDFSAADAANTAPVAIINRTMAERYWHNASPLGDHLVPLAKIYRTQDQAASQALEIVGVVADVKISADVWQDQPQFYVPAAQMPTADADLVIRAKSDPAAVVPAVRAAVLEVDSAQPIHHVQTFADIISANLDFLRFPMALVWIFAALALLLAAIGIFGVMSYSASRRAHELAIRIALGASRRDVLQLMLGEGLGVTLLGVFIGVVVSLALGRLIATYLYGVSAYDPLTFLAVALLLSAVALLACFLPARRASRTDPLTALRHE